MARPNQPQVESVPELRARLPIALLMAKKRWLEWVLLLLAAAFYCLCFVHLRADFPNFSPWNDWSKMTDEGWYGGGAIHHFVQGRWFLPDSFNPAVVMPVWPLVLGVWFRLTGVGMVSARALMVGLYGCSLVLLYVLLRRAAGGLVAALAVVLMAVNPFCYAFDRLAVLEPVLVLWMLAGLWLADRTRLEDTGRQVGLGAVVCLLVLTKTTGLFLAPAIAYHLWAMNGWPRRGWVRPAAVLVFTALGLLAAYYALGVRPHYLADFRLLFSINHDRVHLSIVPREAWKVIRDGRWINPILFPVALLAVLWAATGGRELLKIPLFGSAIVATTGYLMFIGYHSNLQPRYYLVITPAVVIVLVLTVSELWRRRYLAFAVVATTLLAGASVFMMARTVRYVAHPEYSFASAADAIAAQIHSRPHSSPMLLSNSGENISLFTGIPAVALEYSTHGLDALCDRYHPGWMAVWTGHGDRWKAKVGTRYELEEIAHYRVFDDPKREELVLYRLGDLRQHRAVSPTLR